MLESYGKLPLLFEKNDGQTDPSVEFLTRGEGYSLFLRHGKALITLHREPMASEFRSNRSDLQSRRRRPAPKTAQIQMELAGANAAPKVTGENKQATTTNYFLGNNPSLWRTGIPNYGRVFYSSVYDGIDQVYYGNRRHLEHDFLVHPQADPGQIVVKFQGDSSLKIDRASGDLIIETAAGDLRLQRPIAYQGEGSEREEIPARYQLLAENAVGFSIGKYDRSRALTIDPVLTYSTLLGGAKGDQGNGIVVDAAGEAFLVGTTYSTDFPVTRGSFQTTNGAVTGLSTVFVTKLNATGTAEIYSTFLGGSGGDFGYGIALDASNNVYVTGTTRSVDFPVVCGAYQAAFPSKTSGATSAFVARLVADGSALSYSTYLGGSGNQSSPAMGDVGQGITVDGTGNAYVSGYTYSADFPVSSTAFQATYKGSAYSPNAFVTKINPTGSALPYSTYLGGSGGDFGNAIALDSSGDAYIAGTTGSSDFPVSQGAFQTALRGPTNAFVTELNPRGSATVYSTFLGGSGQQGSPIVFNPPPSTGDMGSAIAVDSEGNAYVAGVTTSSDFPVTTGVLQGASKFDNTGSFVTKLNAGGATLNYSTYLEGVGTAVTGLAIDGSGDAYLTGYVQAVSAGKPGGFLETPDALYSPVSSENSAFVVKLDPAATVLNYATILGGDTNDLATAIAVDSAGNAYVTGNTLSPDFPVTTGAFQTTNHGTATAGNAFVSQLALASETNTTNYPAFPTAIPTTLTSNGQGTITLLFCDPNDTSENSFTFSAGVTLTPSAAGPPLTGQFTFTDSFNYMYPNPYVSEFSGTWGSGAVNMGFQDGESMDGPIGPFSVSWTVSYSGDPVYAASTVSGVASSPGCPASSNAISKPTIGSLGRHVELKAAGISGLSHGATAQVWSQAGSAQTTPIHGTVRIRGAKFTPAPLNDAPGTPIAASKAAVRRQDTNACLQPPQVAAPVFSLAAGTYTSVQSVTISDATTGAVIYYTTDGSTPTASSTPYTGAISVGVTETLQAIAVAAGYSNSAVTSAAYIINLPPPPAAMPVFSIAAGTYTSVQSVTISDATTGAMIYYTTDGSTPSVSSTLYTGAISVGVTETLQAIAVAAGYSNSAVASAAYIINLPPPPAAMPVFSIAAGTYTSVQSVTISDATTGAMIYYTTDGSTPSASSTLYTGAISVGVTETLQAIAVAAGYSNSPVASAAYVINLPPASFMIAASPSSLTIMPGGSGTSVISITPQNGFASATTFSCTGLGAGQTCSFAPATVTPTNGVASTTLTISASATASELQNGPRSPFSPRLPGATLAIAFLYFGWRKRRRATWMLVALATLALGATLSGCGGHSTPKPTTSTISVVATSGTIQQTVPLTVTIQ